MEGKHKAGDDELNDNSNIGSRFRNWLIAQAVVRKYRHEHDAYIHR